MSSLPSSETTGSPARGARAPAGLTVDGYQLLTRIGEGGMGVVHLARRPGGERVALKVLRPHIIGDDEARSRLAREVNSLSRIKSPGVAEIVDADPWGDIPYVATRYVPGLSLHDYVREEGPITARDLPWFAARLADALAAVHAQGVLHRDIKPANVLMEGRAPILIDFGLARVADDPKLTLTGWLLGTPGYLAPEILLGENATEASDVHSWAATVAFAGTGVAPFGRGPAMAVMDRVRRGEHTLDGLPPDVRRVVAAALHPDPSARPRLGELISRLHGLVQSSGRPHSPADSAAATFEDDFFTAPLAIAALAGAREETAVDSSYQQWSGPEQRYSQDSRPEPQAWAPPQPPRPRPTLAVRARRATVLGAGALAGGAAIAAYPYLATFLLVVAAWLARSGSLAAEAADNRRLQRGRSRWYDRPRLVLALPWHLLQSLPGTLILALWGLGLATAAALLGYAVGAGLSWVLLACGVSFTAAMWLGPGGRRVREPAHRVLGPLTGETSNPIGWLIVAGVLVSVALGAAYVADTAGPDWAPAQDHLFADFNARSLLPGGLR